MCPLTLPPIARESHAPAWPPSRAEQPPLSTLFTPSEGLASVKPEKTPSWEEDEELARRLITRDRQAFDTFYQRYAPVLLRRLYRMTGDRQQAQEFTRSHDRGDSNPYKTTEALARSVLGSIASPPSS